MAISQAKPYVAAPRAGLVGKPMGAQAWLLGTICGAHETFWDWLTHQGRALCPTTSVTWRFLQPFLGRFSRTSESMFNLFQFTFSSINRIKGKAKFSE